MKYFGLIILNVGKMSIVVVDERFRVIIPREVRRALKLSKGQRLYVVASGNEIIMRVIPKDPSERIKEILGDFEFNREERRKAEEWLLKRKS